MKILTNVSRRAAATVAAVSLAFLLGAVTSRADIIDPLHGCENSPTASCSDNGTVTPVNSTTPHYGFTASPGPQTGTLDIITLIPNSIAGGNSLSFNVNGITATLFSATAWTSGFLDSYLGISASPSNPVDAFLPTSQSLGNPTATGYFVYLANLGTNTLQSPSSAPPATPDISDSIALPTGASITAFLLTSSKNVATASSGQLSIQGGTVVPEPTSLILFGFGMLGFVFVMHRHLLPDGDSEDRLNA